ncbi:MAG: PKD domain-containing protein, partial [Bacteroidota bacterium]
DGATSDDPNPSFTYTEPGWYDVTLTVAGANGCAATAEFQQLIQVLEIPEVQIAADPEVVCVNDPVEFTATGLTTGVCNWDFGDGQESDEFASTSHAYATAGTYTVIFELDLPENCPESVTAETTVTVIGSPDASFTFGPQPADAFDPEVTFTDASTGNPVLWEWQFGQNGILGGSTDQNTSFTFPALGGFYPVELVVTNEEGCADSITAVVGIVEFFSIYIPNAFTPDGDGVNDVLQVESTGLDESSFQIDVFDRWGGKVFSSEDPHEAWIGNRQGGEYFLPDGIYVYRVKARPLNSLDSVLYEGSILLMR